VPPGGRPTGAAQAPGGAACRAAGSGAPGPHPGAGPRARPGRLVQRGAGGRGPGWDRWPAGDWSGRWPRSGDARTRSGLWPGDPHEAPRGHAGPGARERGHGRRRARAPPDRGRDEEAPGRPRGTESGARGALDPRLGDPGPGPWGWLGVPVHGRLGAGLGGGPRPGGAGAAGAPGGGAGPRSQGRDGGCPGARGGGRGGDGRPSSPQGPPWARPHGGSRAAGTGGGRAHGADDVGAVGDGGTRASPPSARLRAHPDPYGSRPPMAGEGLGAGGQHGVPAQDRRAAALAAR
jgi:translation initiation factor IF-2